MRLLRHYRDPPADAKGAVVALGNFDGVHLGHRALLMEAKRIAAELKRPFAVLVFEPNPREFFRPNDPPFRLTPFRAKARLLSELGVDLLIVLTFDAQMAAMAPQDFVLDVLVNELAVSHVVVGKDFRFGKGRGGDAAVLGYMGEMEGFGTTIFSPVFADGSVKISSTDIRTALKAGRPDEAARLLGHWWRVEGHVAPGEKRGRLLGYPTANLKLGDTLQPAFGIYAVRAHLPDGRVFDGAASFGIRPTFALDAPLLEVHLFDFSGDLYGALIAVEFIAYLRPERHFESIDALKAQIAADCDEAKRILLMLGGKIPEPL
jgi:riboflavin kinase / FMN adenylyltransferase